MASLDLATVPEAHRDTVGTALQAAFGSDGVTGMSVVAGGASGALTYRVDASDGPYLLRVETLRGPLRNPHQYECMQIAADAGIAPPIRHLDDAAGVVVMPFLSQQPLTDFPAGHRPWRPRPPTLLARLHVTTPFPVQGDHLDNLDRMLRFLERSGRVAPGLLDVQRRRLRAASGRRTRGNRRPSFPPTTIPTSSTCSSTAIGSG